MNLVDLLVIAIIAISALLGLSRGFVREMLGLGAWLVAAYGAFRLGPQLLPFANRTLGLVFGAVRGAVLLIAAYILGGVVLPHPETWPPQVKQARTVPLLYDGAVWAAGMLPDAYRPAIAIPPDDHPLTSGQLLHVTPDGAALGPRPH
jgi:membrane protein required for colicin V production